MGRNPPPRLELSKKISQSLNISTLVSQVLINRGVETPEQANSFLSANLQDLHSPFLMKNMERAVDRVLAALKNREKIYIYGDYDVDGITATSTMLLFLREVEADVSYYIPSRLKEGYGLNINALKKIKAKGAKLIITVDCGVSDFEEISYANSIGLDVIVTDHHEVPDIIAPAYTILNPKQPGCAFPFKGLAGVGVAFNLVMALRKTLRDRGFWQPGREPNLKMYLDLVAVGTIADIVPMVDENRILVRNGLEVVSEGKRPGIKALKTVSGIDNGETTSNMVAFRLAPRINSSGRIADAEISVELMLCSNAEEASSLAKKIDEENTRRQRVEKKILAEALAMVKKQESLPDSLILASPSWHPGVIGICASRLCETFSRPSILIAIDEKKAAGRGSARTIKGFDIYNAIKQCGSLLKAFGGHKNAAGINISLDNLDSFIKEFNKVVKQELTAEDFMPSISIDAEIPLGQLSYDILEEIEGLAPFGASNPEPIFSSRDIMSYSSMVVGNGHLKLKIKEQGHFFDAIGFNMASKYCLSDEKICLAFVPQFNYFNGEKTIQLNLKDIKTP